MALLEKENIQLRALEKADLELLYSAENDTDFWEVSSTLTPYSKDILSKYLENAYQDIYEAKQLRMMITTKTDNMVIGMVDLFDFSPRHNRAGIGILIFKNYQGKGYGSTALHIFCQYAFRHLDIHQLYANIPLTNTRSAHLFSTMGFKEVGIQKDWIKVNGKFQDVSFVQLINQNHL